MQSAIVFLVSFSFSVFNGRLLTLKMDGNVSFKKNEFAEFNSMTTCSLCVYFCQHIHMKRSVYLLDCVSVYFRDQTNMNNSKLTDLQFSFREKGSGD